MRDVKARAAGVVAVAEAFFAVGLGAVAIAASDLAGQGVARWKEEHDVQVGDRIELRRAASVARYVRTPAMGPFLSLLRKKILNEDGRPV
ncbi:MAG: hypothetical protein M3Z65_05350 [Chloroflexota bacterium]|nr:hypothetical protein [Chloroflexota bacterium]